MINNARFNDVWSLQHKKLHKWQIGFQIAMLQLYKNQNFVTCCAAARSFKAQRYAQLSMENY